MYTGSNDCCRIVRGPGTDLTSAKLEVSIRVMTGKTYTPESLVLLRGIKALCEDQAMRPAVLASMPTLDEGGLVVRPVGGDPNRVIQMPGTSPNCQRVLPRRSGPRREGKREGTGAGAPPQAQCGRLPDMERRRGTGSSLRL
jgi:hypothetical protein